MFFPLEHGPLDAERTNPIILHLDLLTSSSLKLNMARTSNGQKFTMKIEEENKKYWLLIHGIHFQRRIDRSIRTFSEIFPDDADCHSIYSSDSEAVDLTK